MAAPTTEDAEETIPVGEPLLDLATHISGPEISQADVTDRPIIIQARQSHCSNCPPHREDFEKYARRKKRLDATFLIWHSADKPALAKSKSKELDLDTPVYHGKMIKWDEAKFGPFIWPHLILIDPQGEVVSMGQDHRKLESRLKEMSN